MKGRQKEEERETDGGGAASKERKREEASKVDTIPLCSSLLNFKCSTLFPLLARVVSLAVIFLFLGRPGLPPYLPELRTHATAVPSSRANPRRRVGVTCQGLTTAARRSALRRFGLSFNTPVCRCLRAATLFPQPPLIELFHMLSPPSPFCRMQCRNTRGASLFIYSHSRTQEKGRFTKERKQEVDAKWCGTK